VKKSFALILVGCENIKNQMVTIIFLELQNALAAAGNLKTVEQKLPLFIY